MRKTNMNAVFFLFAASGCFALYLLFFVRMRENLEDVASQRRKIELQHHQTQNTRETETEKNAICPRATAQAQRVFFVEELRIKRRSFSFFL